MSKALSEAFRRAVNPLNPPNTRGTTPKNIAPISWLAGYFPACRASGADSPAPHLANGGRRGATAAPSAFLWVFGKWIHGIAQRRQHLQRANMAKGSNLGERLGVRRGSNVGQGGNVALWSLSNNLNTLTSRQKDH